MSEGQQCYCRRWWFRWWKGTSVWRLPKSILSPTLLSPWFYRVSDRSPCHHSLYYQVALQHCDKEGGHSSVIPTHFPPLLMLYFFLSPQLPSFRLSMKVVMLEKNISGLMASSVLRCWEAFPQFSLKRFLPRYKHSKVALSSNIRIQNPQRCWMCPPSTQYFPICFAFQCLTHRSWEVTGRDLLTDLIPFQTPGWFLVLQC